MRIFYACCSWDEWVNENRVLKYNDVNVQKQKDLEKEHSAKNKKGMCYHFNIRCIQKKKKNTRKKLIQYNLRFDSIEAKETGHADSSIQR